MMTQTKISLGYKMSNKLKILSRFVIVGLVGFMCLQLGKSLILFEITDVFYFFAAAFFVWYAMAIEELAK